MWSSTSRGDVDDFELVNDGHGHDAGDQLLVEVARRLGNCVRETDTVARLGGDDLLRSADAAMYRAKALGGRRMCEFHAARATTLSVV